VKECASEILHRVGRLSHEIADLFAAQLHVEGRQIVLADWRWKWWDALVLEVAAAGVVTSAFLQAANPIFPVAADSDGIFPCLACHDLWPSFVRWRSEAGRVEDQEPRVATEEPVTPLARCAKLRMLKMSGAISNRENLPTFSSADLSAKAVWWVGVDE
jgi:hypothetical protein